MSDPTSFTAGLSEEERIHCIGAFICRVARSGSLPPSASAPSVVLAGDVDPDERVLAFLGRVREASPVDIRVTLGLSRSMTYRTLQRLVLIGRVVCRGSTKAVVYHVAPHDPSRN